MEHRTMPNTATNVHRGNIERRRLGWYAILNVPKDCREKLGRRRFLKTLETQNEARARIKAIPLVELWKGHIAAARDEINAPRIRAEARARAMQARAEQEEDAQWWWRVLRSAGTEEERAIVMEHLTDAAYHIGTLNNEDESPFQNAEAIEWFNEATGRRVKTAENLDAWLASMQVTGKTVRMRRSHVERLAKKFPLIKDVTRKAVRGWITDLMAEVKPATIRRMLSDCRTYWAYLATIEVVADDAAPFDKLGLKVPTAERMHWPTEDLWRLHRSATRLVGIPRRANDWGDAQLADCILLAMYSGARLGELVNLRIGDVSQDHFKVTTAKTRTGIRDVPIHPKLQQTMARLIDQSTDGYVLSGIAGGDRADTMSKAFSRLRKSLGYTDERLVFHSIRHSFVTQMERAGAELGTYQDIVGHKRSTMTGATYSGKSTLAMRREALAKLVY